MRNAKKKVKKDPCGGGVTLRTLTEDYDSGLRLVRNAKKRTRVAAVWRCGGFLCDDKAYPSLVFDFDLD